MDEFSEKLRRGGLILSTSKISLHSFVLKTVIFVNVQDVQADLVPHQHCYISGLILIFIFYYELCRSSTLSSYIDVKFSFTKSQWSLTSKCYVTRAAISLTLNMLGLSDLREYFQYLIFSQ